MDAQALSRMGQRTAEAGAAAGSAMQPRPAIICTLAAPMVRA